MKKKRDFGGCRWPVSITLAILLASALTGPGKTAADGVHFEVGEGFQEGDFIEEHQRWHSTPQEAAWITREIGGRESNDGQALRIEPLEPPVQVRYQPDQWPGDGVRFIHASFRPTTDKQARWRIQAGGSELEFALAGNGELEVVVPGAQAESVKVPFAIQQVGADKGQDSPWLHLMVRQDLAHRTWDFFLDGTALAGNLAMANQDGKKDGLEVEGDLLEPIYFGSICVSRENPLFKDSDTDGMPDAYEVAHRLDPYANDRNRDVGGITAFDRFLKGMANSGNITSVSEGGRKIIYVDNVIGDDACLGEVCYSVGGDRPKASLKAAMASAPDGSIIIVMPGSGLYEEGSRNAKGKKLTIRTVKPVTIR